MKRKIISILLIVTISSSIFANVSELTAENTETYRDGNKNSFEEDSLMLEEPEQNSAKVLITPPEIIDIADRDTLLTRQILRDMKNAKPSNKIMDALLIAGALATVLDFMGILLVGLTAIAVQFSDGTSDRVLQMDKKIFLIANIIASSIILITGVVYSQVKRSQK